MVNVTEQEKGAQKQSYDPAAAEAFVGRVFGDLAATMATVQVALGDRYGLFKDMAACGPQTAEEIAACTSTNARYVKEWASCLFAAGYLDYDPATAKFSLPAAHAPALAEEGGPFFLGGFHQTIAGCLKVYEPAARAYREGGGVPVTAYDRDLWEGEERANEMWHNNLLVGDWIPRLPEVKALLERGVEVADVGCGCGRAAVRLAQAFPKSRFVGYDIHPESVEKAREFARKEGVADRVRFEVLDITKGLPGKHDIVTAFDVVHDVQDPPKLLKDIRKSLRPGGRFVVMELNVADKLEENKGPVGTVLYGISPLYCMTLSLGRGGAGYGTAGMPFGRFAGLAKAAGFAASRRIDVNNPVQVLYEADA